MMPGMDGLSAMAELRRTSNVPVILLTAKSEDTDKVLGLNLGADDYVTKPFNPIEVMARVRSQLRRYLQLGGGQVLPTQVTIGGIMLEVRGKRYDASVRAQLANIRKTLSSSFIGGEEK